MNHQKIHRFVDWFAIIIFLFFVFSTMTTLALWEKFTYIAPPFIFVSLGILLLNHVSLKDCFQKKETEFFLMCGGILLSGVNIILIKSNIGAFFTIADFLLILYLANKIRFDRIQMGVIAFASFLILFYWLFINKESYGYYLANPNSSSLIVLTNFCVFASFLIYFLSPVQMPKWLFPTAILFLVCIIGVRILSFNCRGVLLAVIAWAGTYYVLPKKNYTVPFVIGASLLTPVIYVYLWKSGAVDGVYVLGKRFASGRDFIWEEFFQIFLEHPITGLGSNFDVMAPDLRIKEVHHALLDLLFIHGLPVFLIVLYFLYKRMREVISSSSAQVRAVCIASIYGMLTAGTFENYYIVSPYNMLMLMIFIISNTPVPVPAAKET